MMQPDLRAIYEARLDRMVGLTRDFVAIESPTDDKAAVDRLGRRIAEELRQAGAEVFVHPREAVGDIVEARWHADRPSRPLLVVGHLDTVHPLGALAENPIRLEGGRLYGPGAYDMKASLAVVIETVRGLREQSLFPERPVIALMTTDEESGSLHSRELIEQVAANAALALIMEAALPDGSLKTWRKSVGRFVIRAHGVTSHAGGAHESGLNAVEEMAHHVLALQRMTDYQAGTTVNVGVIRGGTRGNVVPGFCEVQVDVRAMTAEEMARVTAAIYGLKPVLPGARLEIRGGFDRPPMERNHRMLDTFAQAAQIAAQYGMTLRESGTGGASDGNYTAAVGTPTLDGLGPLGDGAHSEREYVLVHTLPRSAALLAALLIEWPRDR